MFELKKNNKPQLATAIGYKYIYKDPVSGKFGTSQLFRSIDECNRAASLDIHSTTQAVRVEDIKNKLIESNKKLMNLSMLGRFTGIVDKNSERKIRSESIQNIRGLKKEIKDDKKRFNQIIKSSNHSITDVNLLNFNKIGSTSFNPKYSNKNSKYNTFKANTNPLYDRQGRRKDLNGIGIDKAGSVFQPNSMGEEDNVIQQS